MKNLFWLAAIFTFFSCVNREITSSQLLSNCRYDLFVGTYTQKEGHVDGKGEGIYRIQLDSKLNEIDRTVIKGVTNPSFLILGKNDFGDQMLYCVEETMPDGKVSAFSINKEGIEKVSSLSTNGGAPCHLALKYVDKIGGYLAIANYMGSNVVLYRFNTTGTIQDKVSSMKFYGKSKTPRQEASHPHYVEFSNPKKTNALFVSDLGTDTIYRLPFDEKMQLSRSKPFDIAVEKGAGPRHLLSGYSIISLNELNSTITAYTGYDHKLLQTISTLPDDYKGENLTAEIVAAGDFIYASNRGHNSVAIFRMIGKTGIERIGIEPSRGEVPRNIAISPDQNFLFVANQNSDNIVIFSIKSNEL